MSKLQNFKMINLPCFKPLNLVMCYSSNKKLTHSRKTGREEDPGERIGQGNPGILASRSRRWLTMLRASLVAEMVKNLPAMRESWVRSLGRQDSPGGRNG